MIVLVAFYYTCLTPLFFPVQRVGVHGSLPHTDLNAIKSLIIKHTRRGFFGFYDRFLEQELLSLPWIQFATVQRVWPDFVEVRLKEYELLALLLDSPPQWIDDRARLIPQNRHLTLENHAVQEMMAADLPHFVGPRSRVHEMVQHYKLLQVYLKPLGLNIKKWILAENGSWEANLDNNLVLVLGKSDLERRFKHFTQAYSNLLKNKLSELAYVDLRYKKGLALGWRSGAQPEQLQLVGEHR